jgi:probable HAF family extracellular repeat protein
LEYGSNMKFRFALLAFFLVGSSAFGADRQYQVIDLGSLGGNYGEARGINELGEVTGYSKLPNGDDRAFKWDPVNGIQNLGTLTGNSYGNAISDNGDIVGDTGSITFRWKAVGGIQQLDGNSSDANGINASGTVIGTRHLTGTDKTYQWSATNSAQPLFIQSSQGYAINDFGHRTGRISPSGYYSDGSNNLNFTSTMSNFLPDDINNLDKIVGSKLGEAALYDVGLASTLLLGKLSPSDPSSEAFAISDLGLVVGDSGLRGFLWDSIGNCNYALESSPRVFRVLYGRRFETAGHYTGGSEYIGIPSEERHLSVRGHRRFHIRTSHIFQD